MATISNITVSNTTSTTIAGVNPNRSHIIVAAKSGKAWIKLQPASENNDICGFPLFEGEFWELNLSDIYTGEISAIIEGAASGQVSVTEY